MEHLKAASNRNRQAFERARERPGAVLDYIAEDGPGFEQLVQRLGQWPAENESVGEVLTLVGDWRSKSLLKSGTAASRCDPGRAIQCLDSMHEKPGSTSGLSMLCVLMEDMPKEIRSVNRRPDPLFPSNLIMAKQAAAPSRRGKAVPWKRISRSSSDKGPFPGFGLKKSGGEIMPALPEELYHLPSRTRGRGAPLIRRIVVDAILDVPQHEWNTTEPLLFPEISFGDYVRKLFPVLDDGRSLSWRPSRHLDPMLDAFELLSTRKARISWENPATGVGGQDLIIIPVTMPRTGHVDDIVRLAVNLPPGCNGGAIFDRAALVKAGARSAPAFDLCTSLAVWWYRPGQTRIPVSGGHYIQATHPDPYEMPDHMLYAMCYPSGDYPKGHKETSGLALRFLERIGYTRVTEDGGKRYVLPGQKWIGWQG